MEIAGNGESSESVTNVFSDSETQARPLFWPYFWNFLTIRQHLRIEFEFMIRESAYILGERWAGLRISATSQALGRSATGEQAADSLQYSMSLRNRVKTSGMQVCLWKSPFCPYISPACETGQDGQTAWQVIGREAAGLLEQSAERRNSWQNLPSVHREFTTLSCCISTKNAYFPLL